MIGIALIAALFTPGCGGDSLAARAVQAGQVESESPAARAVQDGEVEYDFTSPKMYIEGEPFPVIITAVAPIEGMSSVPAWALTPAAFELEGTPLGERPAEQHVPLVPGQRIVTTIDLGPSIERIETFQERNFRLRFAPDEHLEELRITYLRAAEKGIDFMTLPDQQLGDYDIVLQTVYGPIWLTLWCELAPNHARNFLDLAYTGFYDDSDFHRVIPGFMVQAGGAKKGVPAPRRLVNEFNDRRHIAGVLAMARLSMDTKDSDGATIPKEDSATSEFFIVHRVSPHLDGNYTAFGKVVQGMDAVEKIVDSVKDHFSARDPRTHKPRTPQTILKAVVVKRR